LNDFCNDGSFEDEDEDEDENWESRFDPLSSAPIRHPRSKLRGIRTTENLCGRGTEGVGGFRIDKVFDKEDLADCKNVQTPERGSQHFLSPMSREDEM
jgi:hypothetical protein